MSDIELVKQNVSIKDWKIWGAIILDAIILIGLLRSIFQFFLGGIILFFIAIITWHYLYNLLAFASYSSQRAEPLIRISLSSISST